MAATEREYPRPKSSVLKWSIQQAGRWVRSAANLGTVQIAFVDHALTRSSERAISQDEAVACICKGRASRWEQHDRSDGSNMHLTLSLESTIEVIEVVVALSDEDPDLWVITMWTRKPKSGR
ncbi:MULTISPECIES: DUF4258 domain-containing protein [Paraburkholderia]|uniref:DUF4258 domain-containing protein n=1 Tax=Paraburkholderia TaxID=1822464 RepID=UPI000A015165|nr:MULTISPECIES: DUF4258 domain-containing protein [Paraburkholderia]MDH6150494.1 hypothetical protein [Paraburkholderia sp. WSM4179]